MKHEYPATRPGFLSSGSASAGRRPPLRLVWAAGLLAAAAAAAGFAQGTLPAPQTSGGIEYVTGGFGADAAEAFKQAESSWPLALVFAAMCFWTAFWRVMEARRHFR